MPAHPIVRARGWRGLLAAAALLALCAAPAPPAGAQPPAAFRAETRLVVLHVTVTNRAHELVTNLDRGAFTVYENGRRQPIALFSRNDVPVSLGLLIDNSGSMRLLRPRVEAAALALVRASNPDDETFVLNFADLPHIDVPLTSDIHRIEAGLRRVDAIGGTAMRDAVDMAEQYLRQHARRDRRVLVVISDGADNASVTPLDRIIARAERDGTTVYAIGLLQSEGSADAKHARRALQRLAESTGGLAYDPGSIDEIDRVALDIARQIRNQYTIAYAPTHQLLDGSYRQIRVTVQGPGGLSAHTRAGYLATPDPPDQPGRR